MFSRFLQSVFAFIACVLMGSASAAPRPNVLFIISDDLTHTAASCYGNTVCRTPNIDRLAAEGIRFTRAYCQATYCGPSRASFMTGYYPHATGLLGYGPVRPAIGDRVTWAQHFKNAGYHTARVSKIYHMGVPGGIEQGDDGSDDPISWTERFNSPGPEWKAPGRGETLEGNPDGTRPVVGGNTFVVVEAEGDDLVHSDGQTAAKAVELIQQQAGKRPFFLAVGFVRPHVPFVAPARYFEPFLPYDKMALPPRIPGDWDDIPKPGINYKTSVNMQMDERRQKKAIGGYYAAVAYVDAQVGKVLQALDASGQADNTIVIFTSDHGFHLGEHDFWAKVSLRDESSKVPLIIKAPGKQPAVCDSFVELLDLYPTVARLCGLEVPDRLQGRDLSPLLDDPTRTVRDSVFCVAPMRQGYLLRTDRWAYLQYGEDDASDVELFDMHADPGQYINLAKMPEFASVVKQFNARLDAKLKEVRGGDLAASSSSASSRPSGAKEGALGAGPDPVRFDPLIRDLEGWTVQVDPALIEGEYQEEGGRALTMLANHLQRISILVPDEALARLKQIGIWIERSHPRLKAMQYHPSRSWLVEHGHDPRLARKVHITQAQELLSRRQMLKHPAVILHELAHGYHDQFLGFDNPEIIAAYEQAMAAGTYENVLLYTGERVKHYGLSNHKEYFAEGTEAYFYRNDFYPFVRAELRAHDAGLHDLLEQIWGAGN